MGISMTWQEKRALAMRMFEATEGDNMKEFRFYGSQGKILSAGYARGSVHKILMDEDKHPPSFWAAVEDIQISAETEVS